MPTTYLWTTLSNEHNRTNMVGQGTVSPNSGNDGAQQSIGMNCVVFGLLVLFVIAFVGVFVLYFVQKICKMLYHYADSSSLNISTQQEYPNVVVHRRHSTTDIGNAESETQEERLSPAVHQEPPPSYSDACESQGLVLSSGDIDTTAC